MSSSTVAEMLKLTDTASLDSSAVAKPRVIEREDVLNAVKQSKSYASGDTSTGNHLADMYTSKDVAFIRATTGYNIVSIGKLTTIVDDDGNPPSAEQLNSVDQIASAIEGARSNGYLTGEITPEYAKAMISSYAEVIKSFPTDWLDKALSYFGSTTDSGAAEV